MKGPKTQADIAYSFVRQDELSEEELAQIVGGTGSVVVAEKFRNVPLQDEMLPQDAAKAIEKELSFRFGTNDFTTYRKRLGVGPNAGGTAPGSDDRYCLYAKAVKRYVYTPALVKKAVADLSSVDGYAAAMGKPPAAKHAIGDRHKDSA